MEIVIIIVLILLNGVLSMSEIALVSARKTKLETEAKKGNRGARKALDLAEEPDRFLSTIQIGITLIGILTGLYSGEALAGDLAVYFSAVPYIAPYALLISKSLIVVVVTYLTLAVVVKMLGIDTAEDSKVTEEEIKAIVKEGYDDGEVQEVEHDIVERVFTLGDRRVDSIMTHRGEMVWLDVMDSTEKIKEKVESNLFDIYPVASGKFDDFLGIVYLKDLFLHIDSPDFNLKSIVRPAHYVPENQSVYTTLEQFKRARVKYAIVTDEFGGIQGIVTLKDIMEGLVGQVPEMGDEQEITERSDGTWLVDGQYSFYDFLTYFDMEDLYAEHDYNTLSGLILEILERLPKTGEKLRWMNFEFEIVDMDGARIDKVLVRKLEEE